MLDRREFDRDRAMIERRNKPRGPVKKDIHWGDHAVLISAIAAFSFYIGYVYGAQVSPAAVAAAPIKLTQGE